MCKTLFFLREKQQFRSLLDEGGGVGRKDRTTRTYDEYNGENFASALCRIELIN